MKHIPESLPSRTALLFALFLALAFSLPHHAFGQNTNAGFSVPQGNVFIDDEFPGGNIRVLEINGDTVRVGIDYRDSRTGWFYWAFRVRNAAGRTLKFEIVKDSGFKGQVISSRGPAVSNDAANWRWLHPTPDFPTPRSWTYTFSANENVVYFSNGMNYTDRELQAFFAKHKDNPLLEVNLLCKTKPKGRSIEYVRIAAPGTENAPYALLLTCRSHAGEMMSSYVLEGVIEELLSSSETGRWFRKNAVIYAVPMIDKDGVEDGDQGKNRRPFDHNRDYIKFIYASPRAISKVAAEWFGERKIVFMDLHGPMLGNRGKPRSGSERIHLFEDGTANKRLRKNLEKYTSILATQSAKGRSFPVHKKSIYYYAFKEGDAKVSASAPAGQLNSSGWVASTFPKALLTCTVETPFANATDGKAGKADPVTLNVEVNADSARAFGSDITIALKTFLLELQ